MYETALDAESGPDLSEDAGKGRIPVDRGCDGHEATRTEIGEDVTESERMLAYPIRTEDDLASCGIHHHERTGLTTFDEGSIHDDVADMREVSRLRRRTIQPVSDDLLNLPRAVSTLERKLSDGVSFDEPAMEPNLLSMQGVRSIAPDE